MPKWCVESYPSSLYKFEKTRFWHFVIISGRGQGGPNPCLNKVWLQWKPPTEFPTESNKADLISERAKLIL